MSQLPRALAPWAKQLAVFPDEIALVLGGLATRIAGIVGDGGQTRASTGEPDGFGGIARRGAYDRLLPTEWLLLEEIPDEFIRRVIAGEHAFFERAYRRDSAIRRTVVLFDAGPWQLGAPRVAQLATLVVLAARAERLSATLLWRALQDESRQLREGVTRTNVLDLVRARSARVPCAEDFDLPEADSGPASELWIVGSPRLSDQAAPRDASVVTIEEAADLVAPGRILVRARARSSSRVLQTVLEMPAPQLAVRILRDPFETAVPERHRFGTAIDPQSNIVFSEDARRLHVRGAHGTVITFGIPNSPRGTVGLPGVFRPPKGEVAVAVGFARKRRRTVVLTADHEGLVLHVLGKRNVSSTESHRFEIPDYYHSPPSSQLHSLAVFRVGHACFVDHRGYLMELRDGAGSLRDSGCAIHAKANWQGLVYVSERAQPPATLFASAGESPDSPSLTIAPSSVTPDAAHWLQSSAVELPFATAAPILHAAVSHVSGHTAYFTAAGELAVYSKYHDAVVLRVEAGIAE